MIHRSLLTFAALAALTLSTFAERSTEAWRVRFDSTAIRSQGATDTAFDPRGNVAVTGFDFTADNDQRWYTAKYSGIDGSLLWQVFFDSNFGDNVPNAVACDSQGNVIVTGYSQLTAGGTQDIYTVKYAALDGAVVWSRSFNGSNGGGDEGLCIAVAANDDVVVAGRVVSSGSGGDIYLVRYTAAGNAGVGVIDWSTTYATPASNRDDFPKDITIDAAGNVAVVGVAAMNAPTRFFTGRYNGATGAVIWTATFAPVGNDSYGANGVATDAAGNVFSTGMSKNSFGDYDIVTIRYNAAALAGFAGDLEWQRAYTSPGDNFAQTTAGIVCDSQGDVAIAGVTVDNVAPGAQRYYIAKYAGADGDIRWEKTSPSPDGDDFSTRIGIDRADNVVVTGTSQNLSHNEDYYTVKRASEDGALLWEQRFNGNLPGGGSDTPTGLDVDLAGNVVVSGVSFRPHPNNATGLSGFVTIKYQSLLLVTGDPAPAGNGIPANAKFAALSTPAVADNGTIAAKATVSAGSKLFNTLVTVGPGGLQLPAVQKMAAPGVTGGKFASFLNPVLDFDGDHAFIATLTGVPLTESTGVWTNSFNGTLQLAIQQGKPFAALPAGVLVDSISTISIRNGNILAVVKLKGTNVDATNKTALIRTNGTTTALMLRTGQSITLGANPASAITKFKVLQPAPGSEGHGRWHSSGGAVAEVILADGNEVFLTLGNGGTTFNSLFTGSAATAIGGGAEWAGFGFPAIAPTSTGYAALATLTKGVGGVTGSDDTAIVFASNGVTFSKVVRENEVAPGAGTSKFLGFKDPVTNGNNDVAFLGTIKGAPAATATGLWYRPFNGAVQLIARLGSKAPKANGALSTSKFTALSSIALPGGVDAGPVFTGTIAGAGITAANNKGIWAVTSQDDVRQVLRLGDKLGTFKVTGITVFGSASGAIGTNRSYNSAGYLAAFLKLSGGKQAIVPLGLP